MKLYTEYLTVNYGKDKVKLQVDFEEGTYSGYYLRAYLETSEERNNFFSRRLHISETHSVEEFNKAVAYLQEIKQHIINILLAPYEQA